MPRSSRRGASECWGNAARAHEGRRGFVRGSRCRESRGGGLVPSPGAGPKSRARVARSESFWLGFGRLVGAGVIRFRRSPSAGSPHVGAKLRTALSFRTSARATPPDQPLPGAHLGVDPQTVLQLPSCPLTRGVGHATLVDQRPGVSLVPPPRVAQSGVTSAQIRSRPRPQQHLAAKM